MADGRNDDHGDHSLRRRDRSRIIGPGGALRADRLLSRSAGV
jgi:hypothetical protein